jgi:hypothetical protein
VFRGVRLDRCEWDYQTTARRHAKNLGYRLIDPQTCRDFVEKPVDWNKHGTDAANDTSTRLDPMMREYTVLFNVDQCDGLNALESRLVAQLRMARRADPASTAKATDAKKPRLASVP